MGGRAEGSLRERFTQQKFRAWQPVLTPKWVITTFVCCGVVFIALAIVLLQAAYSVTECHLEYADPEKVDGVVVTSPITLELKSEHCVGLHENNVIPAPVFLYYELSRFHQNHRRYVKSRSDDQLRADDTHSSQVVSACSPWAKDDSDRVYFPCGLAARSVFNDTYSVAKDNKKIEVKSSADVIAWESDVKYKFKNPSNQAALENDVNFWLPQTDPATGESLFPDGVETGHFIVWMRTAALPTFRKLWGRIDEDIELPITVDVSSRYPVSSYSGTKAVILSTATWIGGRNPFLGIGYLVVGAVCVVVAFAFFVKHTRSPRALGDVKYLNWANGR